MISDGESKLRELATELAESSVKFRSVSIRELLNWFGAKRRGYFVVLEIRQALRRQGLTTTPDFESGYVDSFVNIQSRIDGNPTLGVPVPDTAEIIVQPQVDEFVGSGPLDISSLQVSRLQAANTPPLSVSPDDSIETAVTMMLCNDYSQLPVMNGKRTLKGVVSWKSIGMRLLLLDQQQACREFMDPTPFVMRHTDSLFSVTNQVIQHDFVFIKDSEDVICGIITASDLSEQFRNSAEPFVLIGQIENHIRRLLGDRFTKEEFREAMFNPEELKEDATIADLTFGEYQRLIQKQENWEKLGIRLDRRTLVDTLDEIRLIRNDVMHFDPDGIDDAKLKKLRNFEEFLSKLHSVGL